MNLRERMVKVETRLETIQKLMYVVIVVLAAQAGVDILPTLVSAIG